MTKKDTKILKGVAILFMLFLHLFNQNDSPLMDYIFEEGQKIEPNWYLPIIPMILVNGCEGMGTDGKVKYLVLILMILLNL